ncbi:IS3 family transposase, partial [Roseburia sp. AF42-8]
RRFNTHIPHQKITTDTTEFKYYEVDVKGHMTMHKLYTDLYRLYNTNIHEKIAEQKKKEAMLQ